VVSCGGDGTIAVYREVVDMQPSTSTASDADVVMNGMVAASNPATTSNTDSESTYTLHRTKWTLVAIMEGAHDEYEINHVCWAARRDPGRRFEGEEVIVSTADDGDVKIWTLPYGVGDDPYVGR